MATNISINVDRDFELWLEHLRTKYGEQFEILNGLHSSQLDTSQFIDAFIDKNIADVSIDSNANTHHKDVCCLLTEYGKAQQKLICFQKLFYEMKKKYGLEAARDWLESEYVGYFYAHDAASISFKGYCFAFDLTRLATEGLFFIDDYNNKPAKHLTTFVDHVLEFVFYQSNRISGAVGLPDLLFWMYWFWKKDVDNGYYTVSPEYYAKQNFQRLLYRLNQPHLRASVGSSKAAA